jgi:hypothetical protein
MTPKSVLVRVRDLLRALKWTGTSNFVFGASAVYITTEAPMMNISQFPKPCAFVIDQGFTNHPEHPGIGTQNFTVLLFIENVGSNYGEGGIVGKNEVTNTSYGKGFKDISELVLETMYSQITLSGDKIVLVAKSTMKPTIVSNNTPLIFVSMVFNAFCSVY